MVSFGLKFSQLPCSRCGEDRQARFACPYCDKPPREHETDFHVQHRQQAVAEPRARLSDAGEPLSITLDDLWGDPQTIETFISRIYQAADSIGQEEPDGSNRLTEIAGEIASLKRWAEELDPIRPLRSITYETQALLAALYELVDVIITALSAESIQEAQRTAEVAQAAIDRAAAAVARAGDVVDRLSTVLEADDPIGTWLRLAIDNDPSSASERGAVLVYERTGWQATGGGVAVALAYHEVVRTIGNPETFWRLVTDHLSLLHGRRAQLELVARDANFFPRAREVAHDLWTAAQDSLRLPDPETLRGEVGRFLQNGHLIVEQPLKFHLGVACAATTKMDFNRTQASDVSQLVNIAKDKGWAISSELGDSDIRNAFGHRDFELIGDSVSLSPRRRSAASETPLVLTVPELQDAVLQLCETSIALDLALNLVASELGYGDHISPELSMAKAILVAWGWDDVEMVDTDPVTVEISAEVHGPQTFGSMALVSHLLSERADRVVLHLSRTDVEKTSEIEFDTAAFADVALDIGEDGTLGKVAFIRLMTLVKRDGQTLVPFDKLLLPIAIEAGQLAANRERGFPDIASDIKLWRSLAKDLGLRELEKEIGKALRLRAQAEAGVPATSAEIEGLFSLANDETPPSFPETMI